MNADVINELYYGDTSNPNVQRCRERIHWICRQVQGKHVLDLGCSQGIVCLILAREGFNCTGVDIEQASLDRAVSELEREGEPVRRKANFLLADATSLPCSDSQFDTVILGEILEHLTHPATVLQEAQRVLRKGGRVVVTVPFGLLSYHDHKRTYYPGSLLRELEPFFDIERIDLLDGYIAVTGAKHFRGTRTSGLRSPTWLENLAEKTEDQLRARDGEHHRVTTQLNQRLGAANQTIAELKVAISEKEELNQAALAALEARWRKRLATAIDDAEARRNAESAALAQQLQSQREQFRVELQQVDTKFHEAEREAANLREKLTEATAEIERRLAASRRDFEARLTAASTETQKKVEAAQTSAAAELRKRNEQQQQWQEMLQTMVQEASGERDRLQWEYGTGLQLQAEQLRRSVTFRTGAALVGACSMLKEAITHPLQFFGKAPARLREYCRCIAPPSIGLAPSRFALGADDLLRRIRALVSATTPLGETIAVVSKGDDRLVEFLGRTGWHFPQTEDGTYVGYHPADSAEAIAHLEQLSAAGAGFLVIPCTSFWWLDFYAAFRMYLTTYCHCIAFQVDTAAVFSLKRKPPELTQPLTVHYELTATGHGAHAPNRGVGQPPTAKPTAVTPTPPPQQIESAAASKRTASLARLSFKTAPAPVLPSPSCDPPLPREDPRELDGDRQLYHLLGPKTHTDQRRVLLYGNVNTNVIDGSSVWLVNVAKMLSARYSVELLLKAKITNYHLLSELQSNPHIRIIAPDKFPVHMQYFGDTHYLEDYSAAELITHLDMAHNYRFVICRGQFVNYYLSVNPRLNRKLVAYFLMDYYKSDNHSLNAEASVLQNIIYNSRVILAQTQMLKDFVCEVFKYSGENVVLLPPMVGDCVPDTQDFVNRRNICLYAGKFDVEWRIPDIVTVCEQSGCTLQLAGSKFHQQNVGSETLRAFVLRKDRTAPNIQFVGAIDHKDIHARMDEADFSISVRTEKYLASKEFSTKVLEFGARGKPTIVNDSAINRFFLGNDYPLFANTNEELAACLERVKNPAIYAKAAKACYEAARRSLIQEVAKICDDIEAHLKPAGDAMKRVAVLSDDKAHCDRVRPEHLPRCQAVKVLLPRVPEVREEPLHRLFLWADIINVHVVGTVSERVISMLNESGKTVACTARDDLGFARQAVNPKICGANDLLPHDNALDVSVIIPCKDVERKLVERALDSVFGQKGLQERTYEVILVDDHSQTLLSDAIAPRYRDHPSMRIIRNSQNKGLGLSRNIGFERARGSCVFFLDADDYYSPDFIGALCGELGRNDVVFSRMAIHHEDNDAYDWQNYVNAAAAKLMKPNGDRTTVIKAVHACVKGYRREAVESGRLFFGIGYHEDIFPWIRFTVENPRLKIGCAESAVYFRTIRNRSAQITQNPAFAEQRKEDLNRTWRAVVELLRYNNNGGSYDALIRHYEKLVTADALTTTVRR